MKINERWIIKSGTDFRDLSLIEMGLQLDNNIVEYCLVTKIQHYIIDSKIEENQDIAEIVHGFMKESVKELDKILGYINCDLDGRFTTVRLKESNLGNFICDIVLEVNNDS